MDALVLGGLLFREIGTKLKGGYAKGFRAPTLNELFFHRASVARPSVIRTSVRRKVGK